MAREVNGRQWVVVTLRLVREHTRWGTRTCVHGEPGQKARDGSPEAPVELFTGGGTNRHGFFVLV